MVLSFVGTSIQLGLLLHAGVVMTALKLASAISTCEAPRKQLAQQDAEYILRTPSLAFIELLIASLFLRSDAPHNLNRPDALLSASS